MRVLFVCTGNICRSPMAETFARSLAAERGIEVEVASAGVLRAGESCTDDMVAVMRARGLDMTSHRSRQLASSLDPAPDVIVAMAKEHVAAVERMRPDLGDRTFTLKRIVRAARSAPRRSSSTSLTEYLRTLRAASRDEPTDDVADPIGAGVAAYEACADELSGLIEAFVDQVLTTES